MNVGDRVLAQWPVEVEWWYPGTIVDVVGGQVDVLYDDGDRSMLAADQIKPLALTVGDKIFGNWKGGGRYYPGRIASITGEAISIDYEDGDKEKTGVRMIRINQSDL